MTAPTRDETGRPARGIAKTLRIGRQADAEDTSSLVSAFVYGNILVLAAVVVPGHDGSQLTTVFGILATGFATQVAHVLSELVAMRVRLGRPFRGSDLRHEIALSRPIASAAVGPAVLLFAAHVGWLQAATAYWLSLAYICGQLAMLGWTLERAAGERSSWRVFTTGLGLALAGVAVAVLKSMLSH